MKRFKNLLAKISIKLIMLTSHIELVNNEKLK